MVEGSLGLYYRRNEKSEVLMQTKKLTIYEALKEKLKREPTHNELVNEVLRILTQTKDERQWQHKKSKRPKSL